MPDPIVATKPKESQDSQQQESSGQSEQDRKREELLKEKERREKAAHAQKVQQESTRSGKFNKKMKGMGLETEIGQQEEQVDPLDQMLAENTAGRPDFDDDAKGKDDIEIADGWKGGLALGRNQQKVEFTAPTGLKFPPPDGFSLPLASIPIPIGGPAPIFIMVELGVAGDVTLDDLAFAMEHKRGTADVLRQDRYAVTGKGGIAANFGIELKVAVLVGAPKIANLQAGVKASAKAGANLNFEAGGQLDVVTTVPGPGGSSSPVSKDGEIYFNLAGGGALTAELAAYLGYELLTFNGEFYSISIAKATLASLELGARFGVRYTNGKSKFFAEPIANDYVNFDWLFKKLWKARKLDKAKDKAVEAQGDAMALMNLQDRPDMEQYIADLKSGEAKLEEANGRMQLLVKEKEDNERSVKADHAAIEELERKIVQFEKQDAELKSKRWKITNKVRGDLKELKQARKQLKSLRKHLVKKMAAAESAAQELQEAERAFIDSLDPATIEARISEAKKRADDIHRENWDMFTGEVTTNMAEFEKRYADVRDQLAETNRVIEMKNQELADGTGLATWEAERDEALAEEQRLAELVNGAVDRNEQLQNVLNGLGPEASTKDRKKAEKDLAGGEKKLRLEIAKWEAAHGRRLAIARRSPIGAITEQLSKLESRRLLLTMKLEKLQEDRIEAHLEEARLLPNVPDVKKKPKKKDE